MTTWVRALAALLVDTTADRLPPDVIHAGCRATLDTVACALDHASAQSMGNVVQALGGPPVSSLIGGDLAGVAGGVGQTSAPNAVLFNGTLIRALDCNDIFIDRSVGGHPSDNLAVALAFAEAEHASGREYLRAVALGYELYWRLRRDLGPTRGVYPWDHVSVSGLIAAAMAGLLMGLDADHLAEAMAIGGAQTHTLSEVRGGEISMLKASANAVTAHAGALAALLARAGMTGPEELFEGRRGLLAAMGLEPTEARLAALIAPPDHWHILDVMVKPYPSIGTGQGAIAAALELVRTYQVTSADVEQIEVHFADLPITHDQIGDAARADPQTRETADHSFPFLVSVAIEDGEVGPAQFANERWRRPETRDLMHRVTMAADPRLNAYTTNGYPASVTIRTRDGRTLQHDMLAVPGSPLNPMSDEQIGAKLRRFAPAAYPSEHIAGLEAAIFGLPELPEVAMLGPRLRGLTKS